METTTIAPIAETVNHVAAPSVKPGRIKSTLLAMKASPVKSVAVVVGVAAIMAGAAYLVNKPSKSVDKSEAIEGEYIVKDEEVSE